MHIMQAGKIAHFTKMKPDILDVCRDYGIKLNRKNKAICPFHNEKTPSFSVTPEAGLFHCFGCGVGGDSIRLLALLQGKTDGEVLKDLAKPESREDKIRAVREAQKRQALIAFNQWIDTAFFNLADDYRNNYFASWQAEPLTDNFWDCIEKMTQVEQRIFQLENDPTGFYEHNKEVGRRV